MERRSDQMPDGFEPEKAPIAPGTPAPHPRVKRLAGSEFREILRRARDAGRPAIGSFLLYLGGALLLTASAWTAPTTRWIGSCCDPEQSIWFVRWIPYVIAHGTDPLFTGQLNAPDGANLMWNTST